MSLKRRVQVDVGLVERHGAALGDLPGFVEVGAGAVGVAPQGAQPGTGKQAARKVIELAGAAKSVHGLFDFGFRVFDRGFRQDVRGVEVLQDRLVEPGAAQCEVVESDIEKRHVVLLFTILMLCVLSCALSEKAGMKGPQASAGVDAETRWQSAGAVA